MTGLFAAAIVSLFAANLEATHFEFFNSLSGHLEIELSEPSEAIGGLENQAARGGSRIVSLRLKALVYDDTSEDFREVTTEEYAAIAYAQPQIQLRGQSGEPVTHRAPNGQFFTVRDLLDAVSETERQTRANTDWFDGVDIHHVWFEGIWPGDDDVWEISWGS